MISVWARNPTSCVGKRAHLAIKPRIMPVRPPGGPAQQARPSSPHNARRRQEAWLHYPNNCRPMISFMISLVPPKIAWTRESTKAFAMGYSSM
jgi:hypothetical protein